MQSSKFKKLFQQEIRQFRVVVITDAEQVYEELYAFDALDREGERYDVHIEPELFQKRWELFRGGHRLVLLGRTDNFSRLIYAIDAWFDRDCT